MLTLDELEIQLNYYATQHKVSEIKNLYQEIRKFNPLLPKLSEKIFEKTTAANVVRDILSNYAIYLYRERLREGGCNQEVEKEKLHSYLYEKNWDELFQMVQLEEKGSEIETHLKFVAPKKVVYNFQGYDDDIDISPPLNSEKGAPLELNPEVPIGYIVNLPPGEINGIQVNVYGGTKMSERKDEMSSTVNLSEEEKALLANGIAIVRLNLIDLLKLNDYQNEMPSELHTVLHESINRFWETIHYTPEKLSHWLSGMNEKPIFLRGASWGGRTAIRHAELYPNTFSGYISADGSISAQMDTESDRSLVGTRTHALDHLDPASHIQEIQDPILLIHNANDNNVNLKVSLDFYDKAKKAGKEELLSLHINHKGNSFEREGDVWNTGHYTPNPNTIDFESQVNAVSNFIMFGQDNIRDITTWRSLKYNIISDRNYNLASADDLFVEYVNRKYKTQLPDHEMLSKIYSVFKLMSKNNANLIRANFNSPISDAELEAGLTRELARINSYLNEKYDIRFDLKVTSEMVKKYHDSLLSADAKLHRELLLTFIFANPHYIDKIHDYVSRKSDYEKIKRDVLTKLIKQRSAFRSASKRTLTGMLEHGLEYERKIDTKIKKGDLKSFLNLVNHYNQFGNAKTLTERLERIFSQMPEDTKRDMIYKVVAEIITDLSINDEVFKALRSKMLPKEYDNLLHESRSSINQMISGWRTKSKIQRLESILIDIRPDVKNEFIPVDFLQKATLEELNTLLSDFSNEGAYNLFSRIEVQEIGLNWNHDVSYLKYIKDCVGEKKFKKLIELRESDGLRRSLLSCYASNKSIESFDFLMAHMSTDELIEHIKTSSGGVNLLVGIIKRNALEVFELLLSRLQFDGKYDLLRTLILDVDNNNNSGLCYLIEMSLYNSDKGYALLEKALELSTPRDLASEFKAGNLKLPNYIRDACESPEMKRKLILIKEKLGDELFREVVSAQAKDIVHEMINNGNVAFNMEVEELLGADQIKKHVEDNLDEWISSSSFSINVIKCAREYYCKSDCNEKVAKYCVNSLKETINSPWSESGLISEILNSLEPKEYAAFQRQLILEAHNFAEYFSEDKIHLNRTRKEKLNELLSAPDRLLPNAFIIEMINAIVGKRCVLQKNVLIDTDQAFNLSLLKKIIDKSDDTLVEFIFSPSASLLLSVFLDEDESEQKFIVNLVSSMQNDFKKELISGEVLQALKNDSFLSAILDSFSNDEIYSLFSRVDEENAEPSSDHNISCLKYVQDRIGNERFKSILEFDVGEGLKGSILKYYIGEEKIESFKYLIEQLSADELIKHIQNNKNISMKRENLIAFLLSRGFESGFDILTSKLQSDGKMDLLRTLILDVDNSGDSGLSHAIEMSVELPDELRPLLEKTLKFCTLEDLEFELKREDSRFPELLKSYPDLIHDKLGDKLFTEVVSTQEKEIVFEMISEGAEVFKKEVENLLGADRVKQYVENNLDEIFSTCYLTENSVNFIREYCSDKSLNERIAIYCAHSLKDELKSICLNSGRIYEILSWLKPDEYNEFQRQLFSEPDSLISFFQNEKSESIEEFEDKIQELLLAPDEMLPVIFSPPVLKSIFDEDLLSYINLSDDISDDIRDGDKKNLTALIDIMSLARINPYIADSILKPDSEFLKYTLNNSAESGDAFEFCWKHIIFSMLTNDEVKDLLTSDVLMMISRPELLSDALQKLTDNEVFELFNQQDCNTALKQYSEEMLQVVSKRVGDIKFHILSQDETGERAESVRRSSLIFEHPKDNKLKSHFVEGQGMEEQSKNRKKL